MYCIAFGLDSKSNKKLFKLAQNKVEKDLYYIIEKFHLSVLTMNDDPTEELIQEISKKVIENNIKLSNYSIFQGGTTDFEYLVLDAKLTKGLSSYINTLRKDNMKDNYFKLKPHISLLKANKGSFTEDLLESYETEIKIDKIIVFSPDKKIKRQISL